MRYFYRNYNTGKFNLFIAPVELERFTRIEGLRYICRDLLVSSLYAILNNGHCHSHLQALTPQLSNSTIVRCSGWFVPSVDI
jgi:hypothetical protein